MDGFLDGSTDGYAGRIEVFEGRSGRRMRSEAERARIAAESLAPGAKVADIARRHGATRWQVYDWPVELRLGKICGRFAKDLVGLFQLAHLAFQRLHLLGLLGCDPAALASVDLDLLHPFVQRLRRTADLRRNRHNRRPAAFMLPCAIQNHPHSAFAHFR